MKSNIIKELKEAIKNVDSEMAELFDGTIFNPEYEYYEREFRSSNEYRKREGYKRGLSKSGFGPIGRLGRLVRESDPLTGQFGSGRYSSAEYNIWPSNSEGELRKRLVAICLGKTKLRDAFDIIEQQCENMADQWPGRTDEKTVFLFTDKWDPKVFNEFERSFLRYAREHNIWFVFIMITDYGYSFIPFLPFDRGTRIFQYSNYYIDTDKPLRRIKRQEFNYAVIDKGMNGQIIAEYSFNCKRKEWTKIHGHGPSCGPINEMELDRFLLTLEWLELSGRKNFRYRSTSGNHLVHKLNINGKTIEWDDSSFHNDRIEELRFQIDQFLNGCGIRI